jgi:hypothetical protein
VRRTLRLPHALPAVIVASLSLAVPFLTAVDPDTQGTAGSVTARAAQAEGQTGGDQRYPVGGSAIETAKAVATSHWGGQACAGQYTVTWTQLDLGTNATASWRNPTDAWGNPSENFDCRIDLNTQADFDYEKLCTVLTHEIGHLLGQQHDANPGQLMSAYYTTPLAACQTADPAASPAPPVAAQSTVPAVSETEGIDIVATEEQPRRTLRKKTAKVKTKKVKKCVTRKRAGTKVKRCFTVTVKVPAAKKATKADKDAPRSGTAKSRVLVQLSA